MTDASHTRRLQVKQTNVARSTYSRKKNVTTSKRLKWMLPASHIRFFFLLLHPHDWSGCYQLRIFDLFLITSTWLKWVLPALHVREKKCHHIHLPRMGIFRSTFPDPLIAATGMPGPQIPNKYYQILCHGTVTIIFTNWKKIFVARIKSLKIYIYVARINSLPQVLPKPNLEKNVKTDSLKPLLRETNSRNW